MTKLIGKDSVRFTLIKPCDIEPDANQPRKIFDEYELSLLTDSIKQNGIIQPLSVRPDREGKYILIAGERRLRAAINLGLKKVPCIIHRTDELTAAYYSIIENLQRSDLTIFEEAEGINRLIKEYGMPYSEIARQLGIAQSTLSNKLRILRLDESMRERIIAARLSERHARAIIRLPKEERDRALDKIIAEAYTIRECEKYIDSLLSEETKLVPTVKHKSAIGDLRIFSNSLSRLVNTMVSCGINARQERIDGKNFIEYRVTIKKPNVDEETASPVQLTIC